MLPSPRSLLLDPLSSLARLAVAEGMEVGDFGAGERGHFTFPSAALVGRRGRVYALDVLESAVAALVSGAAVFPHVVPRRVDIERIGGTGLADGVLDRAVAANVFYELSQRQAAMREIRRTLSSSGRLLVIDWQHDAFPLGPPHFQRIGADRMIGLARNAGLIVAEQFVAGPHHYGIIFHAA